MRVVHLCFARASNSSALTLRVRGVVFHAIKQYLVFGLQPSRSIAYTHSTLKPTVFKVTFCFGFRLFVFVNALHSVVKPHKFGFHNYASFSTNKSLALRYCPHNTLDNTLQPLHLESPRTPHYHALPMKPLKGVRSAIVLAETTSCLVVSARTTAILPRIALHIPIQN